MVDTSRKRAWGQDKLCGHDFVRKSQWAFLLMGCHDQFGSLGQSI